MMIPYRPVRWRQLGSIALVFVLLSGCGTLWPEDDPSLSSTVAGCTKKQPRFEDAWGCVQAKYAAGEMGDTAPKLASFLKFGDDIAGQVASGRMTSLQAQKRLTAAAAAADKT